MQPTGIPDHLIRDGAVRQTVGAPDDPRYADVEDCEALVERGPNDLAQVRVRLELEPGDLEDLTAGGHLWVTFLGGILPFHVTTTPPEGNDV
jgi:hypothetical protein